MSFNVASMEYIGGGAGGALWRFVTTDNLSTANIGDVMDTSGAVAVGPSDGTGYWNNATEVNIRPGDAVLVISNAATAIVGGQIAYQCVANLWTCFGANSNGVSMVCGTGFIVKQ